jgi:hypothetical protein
MVRFFVIPGFVSAIHLFLPESKTRRGCPAQVGHVELKTGLRPGSIGLIAVR